MTDSKTNTKDPSFRAVLSKLYQAADYSKVRIKAGLDAHEQARGIMFTHQEVVTLREILAHNYEERVQSAELKAELAKARNQFMRERECWLALRDENGKLTKTMTDLVKVAKTYRNALQQIELLKVHGGDCCDGYNALVRAKAIARNTLAAEKQERDDVDPSVSARSDG